VNADIAHIVAQNIHFKGEQFARNSGLLMTPAEFIRSLQKDEDL